LRTHLRTHWWVWLLIAVAVVAANEIVDRVGFDQSHWPADILLAVLAVSVGSYGSYRIGRRREAVS
jgi:hypothetical protein